MYNLFVGVCNRAKVVVVTINNSIQKYKHQAIKSSYLLRLKRCQHVFRVHCYSQLPPSMLGNFHFMTIWVSFIQIRLLNIEYILILLLIPSTRAVWDIIGSHMHCKLELFSVNCRTTWGWKLQSSFYISYLF